MLHPIISSDLKFGASWSASSQNALLPITHTHTHTHTHTFPGTHTYHAGAGAGAAESPTGSSSLREEEPSARPYQEGVGPAAVP